MPLFYDWLQRIVKDQGGGGTALVYRDTYLSWRGLLHRVDRRAQELTTFGVGSGSWLGVMLGNVPEFVILAAAASKLGAVFVPLDPTTASRELDMILEAAPLRALITRPHGGDTPTPAAAAPPRPDGRRAGSRIQPEGRRRLQGTLLNVHLYKRPPAELPPGSPRPPRCSPPTRAAIPRASCGRTISCRWSPTPWPVPSTSRPKNALLVAAPLHHGFGFDAGFVAPLSRGASLYLEDELSIKRLSKLLRDERIDVFPGNPTLFGALAREVTVKPLTTKGARFLMLWCTPFRGGRHGFQRPLSRQACCPPTTRRKPARSASIGPARSRPASASPSRASTSGSVQVSGPAADRSSPQPIWVRGKGASALFIPKLTLADHGGSVPIGRTDAEGWFRTGDLGILDRAGRLALFGREDDLVKIDGKRVALGEVAGCLESFPKVKEAEARLAHDELGNPIVVAKVVATPGCKVDELIDHCARTLAPYKVPRHIELTPAG